MPTYIARNPKVFFEGNDLNSDCWVKTFLGVDMAKGESWPVEWSSPLAMPYQEPMLAAFEYLNASGKKKAFMRRRADRLKTVETQHT